MRISYISYGISKTGGYRHEKYLFDSVVAFFRPHHLVEAKLIRKNRLFESVFAYLELLIWSFAQCNNDINIVTSRTALSSILRNLRTKNEVWIVLHNYDEKDGKSQFLKLYFKMLFYLLRKLNSSRFKVIVVAPYWVRYFKEEQKLSHVYLFPNLFDNAFYKTFHSSHKNAWVHLGQYSSKNDTEIFKLAAMLSSKGYYCYFSTLIPGEAKPNNGQFEIIYFLQFKDYLDHLSRSCCNLALSRVNEGWPRISHESILLGTPVIGYDKGGLGDLLKESNSIIVKSIDEAYTCITESLWVLPDASFAEKYDVSKVNQFLEPICKD